MATIVKLKDSGAHAVLVGEGYGQFRTDRADEGWAGWSIAEASGESEMAAVSNATGEILWFSTDHLEVVSIDGESPFELLRPFFVKKTD